MSRGWMKIVRHVWMQLAGPFEVDHCVDNDVGNMDALWSEFTCDRFGEDPLGGFGWRETSKIGLAAQRRRVAGGDDHAVTRFDHRRRQPANEMQQSHDVDLEVSLEGGRVDLLEFAEDAANRIWGNQRQTRPAYHRHSLLHAHHLIVRAVLCVRLREK
jgi:hypothetical protein